jgi:hypothetical protein
MKTYTIYMATCLVNGKRYVGITKQGLAKRKRRHLYLAQKGDTGCNRLYDAIRKYGEDSFRWQSIATAETEKEAFKIERALIKKIRKFSEEYNVTDGGEGGGRSAGAPFPEDARAKLREIGLQNKDIFAKYSHLGPIASRKRVVCLNTGEVYESASEAAQKNSICKSLIIEVCLRNERRKTAKGLVFRYFGDHHGGIEEANAMLVARDEGRARGGKSCTRPIICTTYGIEFSGALAASNEYCIPRSLISEVCNGSKKSAYGLRFSYTEPHL